MISASTIVFDLDGTLVDTAPDLIDALNFVLDREGLPAVPLHAARNLIGAGARKLIERGLELEGRAATVSDIDRMTKDFIDYYADHIAEGSRPFDGLQGALDDLSARGCRFAVCTNKLEWLSKRLLDQLGLKPALCRDLRRRHVRCRQARSGHPAANGGARRWRDVLDHHGGRRRNRHRCGTEGRRSRDRRQFRLYRRADDRTPA